MPFETFALDDTTWSRFVERRATTVFARPHWIRVLCDGLDADAIALAWTRGGDVTAGVCGIVIRRSMFRVLYASLPYGEILGDPVDVSALLAGLRGWARSGPVDQIRLSVWPVSPAAPESFRAEPVVSTTVALPAGDRQPREDYPANVRRNLRRAERDGVVVRSEHGNAAADVAHGLFAMAMWRNRAAVRYPLQYFRAVQHRIVDADGGVTLVARLGDRPIAAMVCIGSGDVVHYVHGGSSPDMLAHRPNDALFDAALHWAHEHRAKLFDFGYSAPEDHDLIRFKEKWCGRSAAAATWVYDASPLKCRVMGMLKKVALSHPVNTLRHGLNPGSGSLRPSRR